MSLYKQGLSLIAKTAFQFKAQGAKGRAITVKTGQEFWVTNCGTDQTRTGVVTIDRKGRGCISHGYAFSPDTIAQYFDAGNK